jgi:hypothetical protein
MVKNSRCCSSDWTEHSDCYWKYLVTPVVKKKGEKERKSVTMVDETRVKGNT